MSEYRLGRHNKQLIYWQDGDEPSDTDPLVLVRMGSDDIVDQLNAAERNEAEQRASSWWEAAKGWCRAAYTNHGATMELLEVSRAARKIHVRHLRQETDRADAAEAKLAELLGQRDEWWESVSKQRHEVEAEHDEARAKLDQVRAAISALDSYQIAPLTRTKFLKMLGRESVTDREEPARVTTQHAEYCARADDHDGECKAPDWYPRAPEVL